eukprot:gene4207-biopygen6174
MREQAQSLWTMESHLRLGAATMAKDRSDGGEGDSWANSPRTRAARPRLFRGRRRRQRNPNTERPPTLRQSEDVQAEPGRLSQETMGDEERSAKEQQAKEWSGEGQRSVAAVAEREGGAARRAPLNSERQKLSTQKLS